MSELGIDAAVFTSYHNVLYYTQFLYSSFGRPCSLVVTQDDITTVTGGRKTLILVCQKTFSHYTISTT